MRPPSKANYGKRKVRPFTVGAMSHNAGWLPYVVPDGVVSPATTPEMRTLEQDEAAGSRRARTVTFKDGGTATASIVLVRPKRGRRVYAYLRFKYRQRNHALYVGQATALTREESLRQAWRQVKKKRLLAQPLPVERRRSSTRRT
jgi:hypothetical protein